jgi:hypothetical protein
MPENWETKAHFEALKHTLEPILPLHDWHIRGIWADATKQEEGANWPADHPVRKGLVYKTQPSDPHEVYRGSKPTCILPKLKNSDGTQLELQTLKLQGLHNSSRALLIDFGEAWLQV